MTGRQNKMRALAVELQHTRRKLRSANERLLVRDAQFSVAASELTRFVNCVELPILILDASFHIRHATPVASKTMNVQSADIGRSVYEVAVNLPGPEWRALISEVMATLQPLDREVQDVEGRWGQLRAWPCRTEAGEVDGVILTLVDIHELKTVQGDVLTANDRCERIVDTVRTPLVVLTEELTIKTSNQAFRDFTNLASTENIHFPKLAEREWRLPSIEPLLATLFSPGRENAELNLEHEDPSSERYFRFEGHLLKLAGGKEILLAIEDITAQKRAEALLRRDNTRLQGHVEVVEQALDQTKDELRALAANLIVAQEDERRRVARELHDDLAQRLALLEMDVDQLGADPGVSKPALDLVRNRIAELATDVRRLAHELHPSILEDLGLPAALKSLVEEFGKREQMPSQFIRKNISNEVPREIGAALFRIAQEALRNVAKHAGKTHVKVILAATDDTLELSIRDFGEGFDVEGVNESGETGLGLVSMQERAHLIGGMLRITSQLGEGTSVHVTVPWRETQEKSENPT